MKILLSPHTDDECLFAAFSIMREHLLPIIVYDGYVQANRGVNVTYTQRRRESIDAMTMLDAPRPRFLGLRDDHIYTPEDVVFRLRDIIDVDQKFDAVWSPIWHADGHEQHNIVSLAAGLLHANTYPRYSTYTRNGGRQRTPLEILPANGSMIARKHMALSCYRSQLDMDPRLGCWPHFMGDMKEYAE